MTRPILAAILALLLTACALPGVDYPRDHTLMYWPHIDGASLPNSSDF